MSSLTRRLIEAAAQTERPHDFEPNIYSWQWNDLAFWAPMVPNVDAADDIIGQSIGTLGNGAAIIPDPELGWMVDLDGTNDQVDYGEPAEVDVALSGVTVSAWARYNATTDGGLLGKWDFGAGQMSFLLRADEGAGNFVHTDVRVGGTNYGVSAGASDTSGALHHCAFTYDGETLRLYVDGIEGGTNASPSGNIDASNTNLFISNVDGGAGFGFLNGKVGDPRIYLRALSANEIWAMQDGQERFGLYLPARRVFAVGKQPAAAPTGGLPAGSLASLGVGV